MYVLVIDSPDPSASSPAVELRALGHLVDAVGDARQAVARAAIEPYEAIVLDFAQAAEPGLLMLHEIRESNRRVPILVVAAHEQVHDRVTALIQGADDYLVRPFTLAELATRLEGLAPHGGEPNGTPRAPTAVGGRLDELVDDLPGSRANAGRDLGLVISEVKLEALLLRVCAALRPQASAKGIRLRLPHERLPTLLIDADWLEYLLSSLLLGAIGVSPVGSEISIRVECDGEHCALEVSGGEPDLDLSPLRPYAKCLRLRLESAPQGAGVRLTNLRRT